MELETLSLRIKNLEEELFNLKTFVNLYVKTPKRIQLKNIYNFSFDALIESFNKYEYKNFLEGITYIEKSIEHQSKKYIKGILWYSCIYDEDNFYSNKNGVWKVEKIATIINNLLNHIRPNILIHYKTFMKDPINNKKEIVEKFKKGVTDCLGTTREMLVNNSIDRLKKMLIFNISIPKLSNINNDNDVNYDGLQEFPMSSSSSEDRQIITKHVIVPHIKPYIRPIYVNIKREDSESCSVEELKYESDEDIEELKYELAEDIKHCIQKTPPKKFSYFLSDNESKSSTSSSDY